MIFDCEECNKPSFRLSCGHVNHVQDTALLLHYDQCSFCRRPLKDADKLFLLDVLKKDGFFEDPLGGLYSCPDNPYTFPQSPSSPTYHPTDESDDELVDAGWVRHDSEPVEDMEEGDWEKAADDNWEQQPPHEEADDDIQIVWPPTRDIAADDTQRQPPQNEYEENDDDDIEIVWPPRHCKPVTIDLTMKDD